MAVVDAQGYRKILVGYDGSNNAKRALERAMVLATGTGASIRVAVVVNTLLVIYSPAASYYPADYAKEVMKDGERLLAEAVGLAKQSGREATGSVEDGHPAEKILQVAEKYRVDVIVLGRRGISGVERFLMGSVSSSVVNHSKCDVLIVK